MFANIKNRKKGSIHKMEGAVFEIIKLSDNRIGN